jgi:hypothetical protein
MASTALAPVEPGGYLALNHTPKEIGAIIADNLGGEQLTEFDLARVKVPSGGGTTWEVPTLGGLEPTKTLTGVLVHFKRTRAYWAPDADSGTPPQCRSEGPDLTAVGTGDPGGPCITCPNAEFGTAVDDSGRPAPGQACNSKEIWFLLREGDYLPIVLALPATSLKAAGAYRKRTLGGVGIRYSSVVTSISLTATKNAKGDSYAVISPTVAGVLEKDEAERAKAYGDELRPLFDAAADAATTDAG